MNNNTTIDKKILRPTFSAINNLTTMEDCEVNGLDVIPAQNRFVLEANTLKIKFNSKYTKGLSDWWQRYLPSYSLKKDDNEYVVEAGQSSFVGNLVYAREYEQDFEIYVSRIKQSTIDETEEQYWRFVYPVPHDEWFLKIQARPYQDENGGTYFQGMLTPEIEGRTFTICSCRIENRYYLFIDSPCKLCSLAMESVCNTIMTTLGLVTGRRYGDYRFSLCSESNTFENIHGVAYHHLQKMKTCPYRIFETNRSVVLEALNNFAYQKYAKDMIEQETGGKDVWFYNEDTVTFEAFSKLLALCYSENDMRIATSMLLDGTMLSIEYQKPFFAVALEVITSALLQDQNKKMPPLMPFDEFNSLLRPKLEEIIDSFESISDENKKIMKNKLTSVNQGANASKLSTPFEMVGYKLSKADSDAIKCRNSVFHGHLSSSSEELHYQQDRLFAESLRLHKLCCILLLKKAGFTGRILNNEVLMGLKEACDRQESPYIML